MSGSKLLSRIANFFTIVGFVLVIFTNILVIYSNIYDTKVEANMKLLQEQIKTLGDLSDLIVSLDLAVLVYKRLENEENIEKIYEYLIKINLKSQQLSAILPPLLRVVAQKIYLESSEFDINTINNIKKFYFELSNKFNLMYLNQKQ